MSAHENVEYFEPRGNAETAGMRIPETSAESPTYVKDWLKHNEILSLLAIGSQVVVKKPSQFTLDGFFICLTTQTLMRLRCFQLVW